MMRRKMFHHRQARRTLWLLLFLTAGPGCPGTQTNFTQVPVADGQLQEVVAECRRSDPEQCLLGAQERLWGPLLNLDEAKQWLDIACEGGIGMACSQGGTLVAQQQAPLTGAGEPAPLSREAIEQFERGCLLADGQSCQELAECHLDGNGCDADVARAAQLFDQGCAVDYAPSCLALGDLQEDPDIVAQLSARPDSGHFWKLACGHGEPEGCERVAEIVEASGRDLESSLEFQVVVTSLEADCDRQSGPACYTLAGLYDEGWGVRRNAERSVALLNYACEIGYQPACHQEAARALLGYQDMPAQPQEALSLFDLACQTGYIPSCETLIELYEGASELGEHLVEPDLEAAREVMSWTCEYGYQSACQALDLGQLLSFE